MSEQYNGWANYQTWCVNLWLWNDESNYEYWRDEARRHIDEASSAPQVKEGVWTARQAAKFNLADQLRKQFEEEGIPSFSTVYSDLLRAALSAVDWHEIAEGLLSDVPPNAPEATGQFERPQSLFETGPVVGTPGALAALSKADIETALSRHRRGDWGLLDAEDWQENQVALKERFRLFSIYEAGDGTRFWIITEADRSVTTVLLPSEY